MAQNYESEALNISEIEAAAKETEQKAANIIRTISESPDTCEAIEWMSCGRWEGEKVTHCEVQ